MILQAHLQLLILVSFSSLYNYCCLASNNTNRSSDGSSSTSVHSTRRTALAGRARASGRALSSNQSLLVSSRATHPKNQTSDISQRSLARIYNNTPPLFIIDSRDLFVDVAWMRPGHRLAIMQASDAEGDPITYSLPPAYPKARDASDHLSIDPVKGELYLNELLFVYENSSSLDLVDHSSTQSESSTRNIYHLNVNADDGYYNSTIELMVRVVNSTQVYSSGSLIPLAPRTYPDSIVQRKTDEFYHKVLNLAYLSSGPSVSTQVRPVLANPSLVRDESNEDSQPSTTENSAPSNTDLDSEETLISELSPNDPPLMRPIVTIATPVSPPTPVAAAEPTKQEQPTGRQELSDTQAPAPLLVGLAIVCSGLAIALVLLLFIIPLSVRRLRRRVKQVERKHERLSHQNSLDSSVLGTSSSLTSNNTRHPTTREPSFSQQAYDCSGKFSSPRPQLQKHQNLVCQNSLPAFTQFDINLQSNIMQNASVANPFYQLNQDQQTNTFSPYCMPLDERLYSTIGAPDEPFEDFNNSTRQEMMPTTTGRSRSPDTHSTGSSTRSLARFLSLPIRRHEKHVSNNFDLECNDNEEQLQHQIRGRTLARSTHVARESQKIIDNNSKQFELERHKLHLQTLIGVGQFGSVWRAQLRYGNRGHESRTVAVKSAKKGAIQPQANKELLAEIELMKRVCNHPNVIKILHCCTSDSQGVPGNNNHESCNRPILLVMEYAELGKLQSLLEDSRAHYTGSNNLTTNQTADYRNLMYNLDQRPASSQADLMLTSRELLKFIYHIAKGMEYVASQSVLHRDLASRNILVSGQRVCKIADFGMARLADNPDQLYERSNLNAKLPVRWWPPEALLSNRFTSRSDVYSFGILMWEIVTLGSTPYWQLKPEQVVEEVGRRGMRPTRPTHCHSQLYQIMSSCWLTNELDRPTFSELVRQLDQLILSANEYIQLDQYPDHNYYNMSKTPALYELL